MKSSIESPEKTSKTISLLCTIALIVLLTGAVGSLGLMLYNGLHTPLFLLLLFVGWVLLPFIGLAVANELADRWSVLTRVTIYILMLVIALGSLIGYSGVLSPPGAKLTFLFLTVPLASWLLMVIVIPIVKSLTSEKDSE